MFYKKNKSFSWVLIMSFLFFSEKEGVWNWNEQISQCKSYFSFDSCFCHAHSFHIHCNRFVFIFPLLCGYLQSLSVEEQQRVLGEDKIGFKKGSGASSPASKKKNPKAKVRPSIQQHPPSLWRWFHFSHLLRCRLLLFSFTTSIMK